MSDYHAFLESKRIKATPVGFTPTLPLNGHLKPFQRYCVRQALARGRSALWAGCGLGKSLIELECGLHFAAKTGKPTLIVAPLGVGKQFEREAAKFGVEGVAFARDPGGTRKARVVVTNYESLHHFYPRAFGAFVCDEAGILKSYSGSTRKAITAFGAKVEYRLAATATPAPNDLLELANQAEFLGVMTGKEIIACFFTQDGNSAQNFRLKRHAESAWWAWVATWATAFRSPADLGFSDAGYDLPELVVRETITESKAAPGWLFPVEARGLKEQRAAKKISMPERVEWAASLANGEGSEPWACWCETNAESEALKAAIPGSMEVRGADSIAVKEAKFEAFASGKLRVMVTKPTIAGWGLNWQHCARTLFVGVGNSYEQQYQAIRRFWRFGQARPVHVHLIASEAEGAILANLRRKDDQAAEMFERLVVHMRPELTGPTGRSIAPYEPTHPMTLPDWLRSEVA